MAASTYMQQGRQGIRSLPKGTTLKEIFGQGYQIWIGDELGMQAALSMAPSMFSADSNIIPGTVAHQPIRLRGWSQIAKAFQAIWSRRSNVGLWSNRWKDCLAQDAILVWLKSLHLLLQLWAASITTKKTMRALKRWLHFSRWSLQGERMGLVLVTNGVTTTSRGSNSSMTGDLSGSRVTFGCSMFVQSASQNTRSTLGTQSYQPSSSAPRQTITRW